MREIKQMNREFSQYYAEFQVIAAHLDWNNSAMQNTLRIGLSEDITDSFTYSDMLEELPAFVTMDQKRDNYIQQRRVEQASQNTGGGPGFTSSCRPLALQRITPEFPLGQWLDIADQDLWIITQAEGGSLRKKGQRGLQMGGVCTVEGSTTGQWSERRGNRLGRLRWLEGREKQ